jgi:hypothetical protein
MVKTYEIERDLKMDVCETPPMSQATASPTAA